MALRKKFPPPRLSHKTRPFAYYETAAAPLPRYATFLLFYSFKHHGCMCAVFCVFVCVCVIACECFVCSYAHVRTIM